MRLVNLELVGQALDSITQAEYEVAIKRNESLWEIKADIDEKINFLQMLGIITKKEMKDMLEMSDDIYRERLNATEDKEIYDVGF